MKNASDRKPSDSGYTHAGVEYFTHTPNIQADTVTLIPVVFVCVCVTIVFIFVVQ